MTGKVNIVADCDIPFLKGVLEPYSNITYIKGDSIAHSDIKYADAILTRTRTKCNEQMLSGSTVKMIATATIGYDHIDTKYCSKHGIEVITAAGCNARGVLQYVMAALSEIADTDCWKPTEKTLGIIGVGNVGSLIARFGQIFGFHVVCCDPPKMEANPTLGYLNLESLLAQSDIVTLHVPLDSTTRGMAGNNFFSRMKQSSIFINSSRGETTDQKALIDNLKSKHIAHAVIDTWCNEPNIDKELLELATFTTPHIAGYSLQGKANGTAAVVHALSRKFGFPLESWYPEGIAPSKEMTYITWEQMSKEMLQHFNIKAESLALKQSALSFEEFRNNYRYRDEFF